MYSKPLTLIQIGFKISLGVGVLVFFNKGTGIYKGGGWYLCTQYQTQSLYRL